MDDIVTGVVVVSFFLLLFAYCFLCTLPVGRVDRMFFRTCVRSGIGRRIRAKPAVDGPTPRSTAAPSGLVSPYSAQWHGFHTGPSFVPAVPDEVVISVLTEAVPFHQDTLIITGPSAAKDPRVDMTRSEATFGRQMKEHFKNVHMQPLRARDQHKFRESSGLLSAGPDSSLLALPHSPQLPCWKTPAEALPPQSLDVVCLAPAVFAQLLQHHPYYLTTFHRVLRPHGIIAITGMSALRIVSPAWCTEEYSDVVHHLREECEKILSDEEWRLFETRRNSVEAQHVDIYLPFPHIKRRVFTTQYKLTIDELVGSLRALPECSVALKRPEHRAADAVGVVREHPHRTPVNPIEVFDGLLRARFGTASASEQCIVAEVDFFVISCDSRRTNYFSGSGGTLQQIGQAASLSRLP